MSRLLKDPLIHFALVGLGLFGAFLLLQDDSGPGDTEIVVTQNQQLQLAAAFRRVWRRPPSDEELKNLIDDWVREELANREAIAMGLARDDLIIRRRLRQKYEAFMDQVASAVEPTEEELQAWFDGHGEQYREPARYSFDQIYFSKDSRSDAFADAQQALDSLDAERPTIPDTLGDALALPRSLTDRRATDVAGRFGTAFAEALQDLPVDRWAGPVGSAYGQHLVFVRERRNARTPVLADVREDVLRDWRDEQLRDTRKAVYDGLLNRYTVVLEPTPTGQPGSDASP